MVRSLNQTLITFQLLKLEGYVPRPCRRELDPPSFLTQTPGVHPLPSADTDRVHRGGLGAACRRSLATLLSGAKDHVSSFFFGLVRGSGDVRITAGFHDSSVSCTDFRENLYPGRADRMGHSRRVPNFRPTIESSAAPGMTVRTCA